MLAPHVCSLLNFYSFTESCACCFIHDHLLLTLCILVQLHSLFALVSRSFFFLFFPYPSLFSFIHLSRFLLPIDFSSLIHFASFPGMSGTGHSHLMSIFALCFPVHSSCHKCMPTPSPLIEFFISSFICNSVFLFFFPPQLPHAYLKPVCNLLAQLFPQIRSSFAALFPLWLSQPFRVTSAHMHTQAHTLLSQQSYAVFPLQLLLTYSIPAYYLQLTCRSLHVVLSASFCGIGKFLLVAFLQQSVIVII